MSRNMSVPASVGRFSCARDAASPQSPRVAVRIAELTAHEQAYVVLLSEVFGERRRGCGNDIRGAGALQRLDGIAMSCLARVMIGAVG
jgi:hypothetical protein